MPEQPPTIQPLDWPALRADLSLRHPTIALYLQYSTARLNDHGDTLTIHVLTPWARAWLHTRLRPIIETGIAQLTGRSYRIEFTA